MKIYTPDDRSIPGVFSMLASIIIPIAQFTLTIPAIAYLCLKNPSFVHSKLPNPRYIVMFLVSLALNWLFYIQYLLLPNRKLFEELLQWDASLIVFVYLAFWTTSMIISSFVIGTSTHQFVKKIKDYGCTVEMVEEVIQDMKRLKSGLSPMLFLVYSTKCILLIQVALFLAKDGFAAQPVLLVLATLWDLAYVTIALDETLSVYKDLVVELR